LRQTHAEIFIIATTGLSQSDDFARSKAAGFDVHLVKPLNLERVVQLVERLKARGGSKANA
jgi:two-component system CheB/CheR fusion protein